MGDKIIDSASIMYGILSVINRVDQVNGTLDLHACFQIVVTEIYITDIYIHKFTK